MAAPADVGAGVTGATAPARPRRAGLLPGRDRDTVVPLVAGLLVALHLALRLWTASGGWFTPLDLAGVAAGVGGAGEVAGPPGAEALTRALASLAPLSWPAVVGLELLGQLAVDVLLYRLLVTLFGRRPAVLLPLTVYLASTLPLVAGVWWSAAAVQLPVQLALVLALLAHVRYLRTGRPGPAVGAAVAVAAGSLFSAGVLLVPLLLGTLTLLWWTEGPLGARVRALGRRRTAWALQAAAVCAGAALRVLLHPGPLPGPGSLADALADAFAGLPDRLVRTVLPGLVGGPGAWSPADGSLAVPAPPAAVVWAAAGVVALTVAAAVLVHRGAVRAWLVGAVATVVALVATAASGARAGIGDPPSATVAPAALALVAALVTGLAFLPVRDAPAVLRARAASGTAPWTVPPVAGAVVAAALLAASLVSTAAFRGPWSDNPARGYVETAQAELAARPDVVLADSRLPGDVVPDALAPANTASAVLAGLPVPPRFLGEAVVVPGLAVLDDEGRIQLGYVAPVAQSGAGPVPDCGWAAGPGPAEVPLDGATTDGRWYVHLTYFAGDDSTLWITAGDTRAGTLAAAGLRDVYVQVSGEVDRVLVEVEDSRATVCVNAVRVGSVRPLPGR